MKFTFEEAELINNFFEGVTPVPNKESVIIRLSNCVHEDTVPELKTIVENTITKIKTLDETTFVKVFNDLPVNSIMPY